MNCDSDADAQSISDDDENVKIIFSYSVVWEVFI